MMNLRTMPGTFPAVLLLVLAPATVQAQGLGTNYCIAAPNSTGAGALMSASGDLDVGQNNLALAATPAPTGQMGIFFYGPEQAAVPFGDGYRCVAPGSLGLFRLYPPVPTGGAGIMNYTVDLTAPPQPAGQITVGSTWNFQAWYRDPVAAGSGFNLSDGYEITFSPGGESYDGMVLVPDGTFDMGDHSGSGLSHEMPVHSVDLNAFYMDIFEVTNEKYAAHLNNALARGEVTVTNNVVFQVGGAGQALCSTAQSDSSSHLDWNSATLTFSAVAGWEDQPLILVSWYGACAYANGLSRDNGLTPCYSEADWSCDFTADGYRLPTEAEREYAARGGAHNPYTKYPWGDSIDGSNANYFSSGDPYASNTPQTTPVGYYNGLQTPVGSDMANGYGLYDMSGNVWEWCWDRYDSNYYLNSPSDSPTGPASGPHRLLRGGSWGTGTPFLRSAYRAHPDPSDRGSTFGFRVIAVN